MSTTTATRCVHCGESDIRLDEHDKCEQCYMDVSGIAVVALTHIEDAVIQFIETAETGIGLSPDQARAALAMSFANVTGHLPGTAYRREAVATSERGMWYEPSSAFDRPDESESNRIGHLRRSSNMSLEALAETLEVDVADLALWEHGAIPPGHVAQAMSEVFGVSVPHVLKTQADLDW